MSQDNTGLHGIERYSSLKALQQDLKEKWYALQNLSPRVGRPAQQAQLVVNSIIPVLRRLHRWRMRQPDKRFKPLSQYRLKKLAIARLAKQCVVVDEKTVRDVCKKLRLLRGSKAMGDYTLSEWKWLIKHSTREDREKARKTVTGIVQKSTAKLKETQRVLGKYPSANDLKIFEIYYSKRVSFYSRVLATFPAASRTLRRSR